MATPGRPLGIVHLIADLDAFAGGADLLDRVRPLLAAGLPSLQLRGKNRKTEDLVRVGRELREETSRSGCLFVVNGDADAARRLEADGLHLPASAPPPELLRSRLPGTLRLGVSCHDAGELANARGADWVFLSPVYATPSKPEGGALGPERLAALARESPAPVYALGGVNAGNLAACLAAGCAGVAAIRAFLGSAGEEMLRAARAWDR